MTAVSLVSQQTLGELAPTVIEARKLPALCRTQSRALVGMAAEDAERERAITGCGEQMQAWWQEYERTSCFSHRGVSDFWRLQMEALIAGRSPAAVAALERAEGLS